MTAPLTRQKKDDRMDRIVLGARPDWEEKAKEAGFTFAEMHGEPYWSEDTVYVGTSLRPMTACNGVKLSLSWRPNLRAVPSPAW
jgi:hypothetical protein